MSKRQVMLDLESMGTGSNSAIIAIGATFFLEPNPQAFYVNVSLQSCLDAGLAVDADTVLWWMKQSKKARDMLLKQSIPLETALTNFTAFLGKDPVNIWGNGAVFDNVMLANAYRALNMPVPWGYADDRCYRTMRNLIGKDVKLKFQGERHYALDDARNQALHLIAMLNKAGIEL